MIKGPKIVTIKGFENYTVCESGMVYSFHHQLQELEMTGELSQRIDRAGYMTIRLSKDGVTHTKFLHRVLAESFLTNPLGLPEVNHRNGIKTDNRLVNLEWTTHRQNVQHAFATGLNSSAKRIVDIHTGKVFSSIKEAASALGMNYNTCCKRLEKNRPDFPLRYLR